MQPISITGNVPSLPWISVTGSNDSSLSKADSLTGTLAHNTTSSLRQFNEINGEILLPCNKEYTCRTSAISHVKKTKCETCKREAYNIYQALLKNDKIQPNIKLDLVYYSITQAMIEKWEQEDSINTEELTDLNPLPMSVDTLTQNASLVSTDPNDALDTIMEEPIDYSAPTIDG